MPTSLTRYDYHEGEPQQVQMWEHDAVSDTGSWVAVTGLRCTSLRMPISNQGISTAQLEYEYGRIDRGDGTGWQTVPPLSSTGSVLHRFVRVMLFNSGTGQFEALWVGVITQFADDDLKQPRSPATDNDTVDTFGRQVLQAAGPEWILQRAQITRSEQLYRNAGDTANLTQTVERGLPFNVRTGRLQRGNATQEGNRYDDPLDFGFAKNSSDATVWNGEHIVEYLFHITNFLVPDRLEQEVLGDFVYPAMTWNLSNQSILAAFEPQIQSHGRSIADILNDLADPRRFLSWSTKYSEGANSVTDFGEWTITFNSASSQSISLSNDVTIPANTRSIVLNTSGEVDGHLSLATDAQRQYAEVVVQGAREGFVQTTQVHAGNFLKKGWSDEDEAAYVASLSGLIDPDEKDILYKMLRSQYPEVFTRFVADSTSVVFDDVYVPGMRWERNLPLLKGWDYTGLTPTKPAGARDNPEYEPMFAFYKLPDTLDGETRYAKGTELAFNESIGGKALSGRAVPRPLDDAFGIELRPSKPAHWQASGVSMPDVEDEEQVFDYETDIWITGYYQVDRRVEGRAGSAQAPWSAGRLVIQLGDVAFYDELAPQTVVGFNEGERVFSPGVRVLIRDDRDKLNDIAQMAYQWYATQRYAYRLRYGTIARDVEPGMIATNIDGATNDSIITEVAYDFDNMQTSIATAYAEPDFSLLAREALING